MAEMILIIDNYDSFVYNLAQYIGELGGQPLVYRNDSLTLKEIETLHPSHIIISPGPCTPLEAGLSNGIIRTFGGKIPILGVCLGHQCIGQVYGGKVIHSKIPVHGKSSAIYHDGKTVFKNIPSPLEGGRYHSLVVDLTGFKTELEISAKTTEGVIMGIRHKSFVVEGIQFHPESIMTPAGHALLKNFLSYNQAIRTENE
jgi:anthranilate synthase/aminodeoxychorismate synthase-like glutamine amidotransferase